MKKTLIAVASTMMLWACSSEEPAMKIDASQESKTISCIRTSEEAIAIAENLAAATANESRSASKAVDASSLKVIGTNTSRSNADTLIYAIDYADNAGFVLISAKKSTEPILAVIDNGSYDETDPLDNTGYQLFMESAKNYVTNAPTKVEIEPGREDFRLVQYVDTTYTLYANKARVSVEWHQAWPENMFCPNKIAGCGPVAIAQILSHFKPNIDINLTFNERPYDHLTIDWNEINKHVTSIRIIEPTELEKDSHILSCNASSDNHTKLAALIREIGELGDCSYGQNNTGINEYNAIRVLESFLSNKTGELVSASQFYSKLQSNGVGLVFGLDADEGGHIWVADGTAYCIKHINTYYNYCPTTKEYDYKDVKNVTSNYIHYNWGAAGKYNGYFLENVFDPSKSSNMFTAWSRYNFSYTYAYIYY